MVLIATAMNLLSAAGAIVAAFFWYLSARNKLPMMRTYWDSTPSDDPFFVAIQTGVILNRWAAAFAGVSAFCAAAATMVSLVVPL